MLRPSPLPDRVMVQCPRLRFVSIFLSGCGVSASPGPGHRGCIHLKATACPRGAEALSQAWEQRRSLRTLEITPTCLPGGGFMFYSLVHPLTPHCCLQESVPGAVFFFFLRFATECHCCSAVLQPLRPPPSLRR